MITFVSLFLGLIVGTHTVEVSAGRAAAEVEFLLDGRSLGIRSTPPWRLDCDFGDELLPHELVAVARDRAGREVGRVRQWVNLPRRPAEVAIGLVGSDGGRPTALRLDWSSVMGGEPRTIEVFLDGRRLAVDDPRAIPLPRYEPLHMHYVRAEVDFGKDLASVSELVFGGTLADRVESEITAVPLSVDRSRRKLTPQAVEGLLAADGAPLEIAAVERGLADLVVVPDAHTHAALGDMAGWAPEMIFQADPERRVGFVFPSTERTDPRITDYTLFPRSQWLFGKGAMLPDVLFGFSPPPAGGAPRLADAVAVAGVRAAASSRRRAVLLVLSADTPDASEITPAIARRYLEALRVPLFVWSLRRELAVARAWGPVAVTEDRQRLQTASRQLAANLDRQRMVWIVGHHLPQRVSLAAGARGLRLAGAGPG